MEAKVDIRKLQVLSDRINQATEALNSVRASVHGLGHTTATSPYGSFGYGAGMQQPMGTMGYGTFNQPFAQGQFSQGQGSPFGTGFVPGMQHTTAMGQQPYNVSQFSQFPQQQFPQQMGGYGYGAQQQMIPGQQAQLSPWQTQYSPMMGQFGLQHTSPGQQLGGVPQQTMGAPYGQQTFPFGAGLQHTSAAQQVPGWGSMSQLPSMQQNVMGLSPEIMEQRALEARANDPYRLAQTFPFAFQAQAPVGIW